MLTIFDRGQVYALDIAFSTGEGKPKVIDEKETNVYKRALDKEYNLKMKVRTSTCPAAVPPQSLIRRKSISERPSFAGVALCVL